MVEIKSEATEEELRGLYAWRILQVKINKDTSEKLGILAGELGEGAKNMGEGHANRARLMILEMMQVACNEFCTKMRTRIEKGGKSE